MFKKIIRELKIPIIVFLTIGIIRSLFINYYYIPSGSMYPNLSIGDYIVVNRLSYGTHIPFTESNLVNWDQPKRGDIVTFYSPDGIVMVKRVVGVPGDTVEVKNNIMYINGKEMAQNALQEEFNNDPDFPLKNYQHLKEEIFDDPVSKHKILVIDQKDIEKNKHVYQNNIDWRNSKVTAKDGEFIMIGDNRDNSLDSRFWGTVKLEKIIGKVIWQS